MAWVAGRTPLSARLLAEPTQIPSCCSGFRQADHPATGIVRVVFGQAQAFAHFAHPDRRPSLAIAGLAAHPVQRNGEFAIRPMTGEFAERVNRRRRDVAWISARLDAGHSDFGVASARPVDQQHRLIGGIVKVADDLLYQDMDQALLGPVSVDGAFQAAGRSWAS